MHAHTPPFTRNQHPSARKLYEETSAIAAAHDAKLDPASDVEAKVHTALSYLYHAQELLKEAFPKPQDRAPKWSPQWLSQQPSDDHTGQFQSEALREIGIGDVEPRHPMAAEALRYHDERLSGPEDHL
jgi:hypothetical protein